MAMSATHTVGTPVLPHAIPVARPMLDGPHTGLPVESVTHEGALHIAAARKAQEPVQAQCQSWLEMTCSKLLALLEALCCWVSGISANMWVASIADFRLHRRMMAWWSSLCASPRLEVFQQAQQVLSEWRGLSSEAICFRE